jgi:hypothetical protein
MFDRQKCGADVSVRVRQRTTGQDARFTLLQEEATDDRSDDNQDPRSQFPELRTTK